MSSNGLFAVKIKSTGMFKKNWGHFSSQCGAVGADKQERV
jgi:hypothetical protein